MPQVMTEEEAKAVVCPFMSYRGEGRTDCCSSACAAWDWVDGERGQLSSSFDEHMELPEGELPGKVGWCKGKLDEVTMTRGWLRKSVIGPRRGECGAGAPSVTVETP